METKVVKVSASSTKSGLFRSIFQPSMDSIVEKWAKQGWSLKATTPVQGWNGRTTHYLLTFEREQEKGKR